MKNKSDKTTPPLKASKSKALLLWFFNPRVWGDWDRSKAISLFFLGMIERFFVLRGKPKRKAESFEQAVAKFDLDEKTLQEKASGLKRLSYSLLAVAIFLFLYSLYQFCFGSLKGGMIALVEVGIALVLAFRYHFWHFQIQQRKLGCSVKEWFKHSFKGERS
ncbi:MAG: type IVB secretion system protein IcmV [Legionellaceae bacterium]|nr:type IVB secretion system protein IcmV [Legionellaceae bacterium]MBP9775101.1 type IVB secretion system protein IcmV [Legionellaceae bacterium]